MKGKLENNLATKLYNYFGTNLDIRKYYGMYTGHGRNAIKTTTLNRQSLTRE